MALVYMDFNIVDLFIIIIVVCSAIISLWRGFLREILSLFNWIMAFFLSTKYWTTIAQFMTFISSPEIKKCLSFFIIFLSILIILGIVSHLILKVINMHLGGADHLLGVFFGFSRGLVINAIIIYFTSTTFVAHKKWWQESIIIPELYNLSIVAESLLKEDFYNNMNFKMLVQGDS